MKKVLSILFIVALALSLTASLAKAGGDAASDYPKRPVQVIVAYKAGGGTDVGARILCSVAGKILGQPLVIVNKPGADGELGYTELAWRIPMAIP